MRPSLDEISEFAGGRVRASLLERYEGGRFSPDLWRSMGTMGLFGLGVSEEHGGSGARPREMGLMLERFARDGCDMGLALSWITHLALCVKSIELYGTDAQRLNYLPRLISGEWVGAAAVSEPGTGAHPAGMETTARRVAGGYVLNGTKLYTTDGSVADVVVVIASTGETSGGGKELTAFLVETDKQGFSASRMDLDFVKTSPHAQLVFEDLHLGPETVLGEVGDGHSLVSRGAYARERAMVISAGAGIFRAAADACGEALVEGRGSFEVESGEANAWIHHLAALDAYSHLSQGLIDAAFESAVDWRESMGMLIYMGISYASWGAWLRKFIARQHVPVHFPHDILLNDMKLILVGERVLYKEGRKRYIESFER